MPPPRKKSGSAADKAAHEDRNLESHPQTRAKLDGYRRYLPHFLGKLGNLKSHVFVLDLFAGSGRVRDGLGWADGSPLVACHAAQEATADFARRGLDVTFSLRFVEPNDEARTTLNRLVGPFRGILDIKVSPGKAADHIVTLLAESSASPTITFLDPDGFGVSFDQVITFGDRAYSEVLLNFDVQGLLRTAGIVQTRSVTNFCGGDWWQAYRQGAVFDENGFLVEYGRRLGQHFNYISAQRLDFPEVHANRAIVQGAYSVKAVDLWRKAIRAAVPRHATVMFDFVSQLERRAQVDGVLTRIGQLAGRPCYYGDIRKSLGIFDTGEPEIHQALYFLRAQGLASWSSALHAKSSPAPIFSIKPIPAGLTWDEVERPPERPSVGSAIPASRR